MHTRANHSAVADLCLLIFGFSVQGFLIKALLSAMTCRGGTWTFVGLLFCEIIVESIASINF